MSERKRGLKIEKVLRTLKFSGLGLLGAALLTLVAFRLHFSFLTASFSFLLLLVLQSLSGDFFSSALLSVVAAGCLDYFFVDPLFSFQVDSPLYKLCLVTFLITGLVITRLVAKLQVRTEISQLNHERLQRLYALAQQLLELEPEGKPGGHLLAPFCGVFGIRAACLFDAAESELHMSGAGSEELEKRTVQAFVHDKDYQSRDGRVQARCIRVGSRTIGAIGFDGLQDAGQTAGPLVTLIAAQLERRHSYIHASQAVAAVQSEAHRTAVLDALAHEFKTPLSTILTAAGALREAPLLGPQHREMTEIVETEAARLTRLTTRLIRTARLEREEIKPWIELIDVSSVVAETVTQYARLSGDRTIEINKESESTEVMADPELLRLAVSQLLDNAVKYSTAGSTVTVNIVREGSQIAVRVQSSGNPIPQGERNRIFDRFYRGVDGRRMGPGSGLGLFVARKIVLALGGSVDLDSEDPGASHGTVFRLGLPVPESERDNVPAAV